MNEVMLTGSLGGNFSFSQNEFNHIPTESDILKNDTDPLIINPSVFNYKIDSGKSNESHSEDSILCNSHDTLGNVSENRIQPNSVYSDSSSAEFEIVSVNVKNTTVINTTYNLISQSIVKSAEKNKFMPSSIQNLQRSPYKQDNSLDKSRVVVQVLTSNPENCNESQTVVENKNVSAQSSNICCFRDDVFKLLSKKKSTCDSKYELGKSQIVIEKENDCSRSSNICSFRDDVFNILSEKKSADCDDKIGDNTEAFHIEDAVNSKNNVVEISSEYKSSNHIVRSRRKKNVKFFFLNGKGTKLSEIESVASKLKNASSGLLRILHYVLFDTYGPCNSSLQISKTRKSILLFCGYPFKRDSESYLKKKNCLLRLPFPILCEMHKVVIGNDCNNRTEMVMQLVNFFMKPKAHHSVEDEAETFKKEKSQEGLSKKDYMNLKAIALREPLPTVEVKRLTKEDIEKFQNRTRLDSGLESIETDSSGKVSSYFLPAYILKGPGTKLKSFPKIVRRVSRAKSQMIEILHYILYGRIESTKTCIRNILEFSGFLPCQKEFIAVRQAMLNNMDPFELFQLCSILCLRSKTNARSLRIKKILAYLSKPSEPKTYRTSQRNIDKDFAVTRKLKYTKPNFQRNMKKVPRIVTPKIECEKTRYSQKKETVEEYELQDIKNNFQQKKERVDGPKLRDFKNICSNIECASPLDLTELNDLLFIKPCDESEIHQRILDFSSFDFSTNSMEYHYRKTLLHYMSFCVIKKIAQLLDIEDWENSNSQADLSSSILIFLMEMKPPDLHPRKAPPSILALDDTLSRKAKSVKPESQIVQICEKKTEERWCVENGPDIRQKRKTAFDRRSDIRTFISSHKNQAVSKKSVLIHRLTKASARTDEVPQHANGSLPNIISQNDEDATPLRALLHHPSDIELQQMITNIIKSDLWSSTMGELVQKVYHCYPEFNLSYRENFIKREVRQVISQLRSNAVDTINSMQCKLSDVI